MTLDPYQYLEGFENHHTSEALPDSLPKGDFTIQFLFLLSILWIKSDL